MELEIRETKVEVFLVIGEWAKEKLCKSGIFSRNLSCLKCNKAAALYAEQSDSGIRFWCVGCVPIEVKELYRSAVRKGCAGK